MTDHETTSAAFGGSAAAARGMELLWGTNPPPSRGRKPGLTVDRIVATAIEVADAEGLDGLSMRRVADALGVGTMSLYRYVPSKWRNVELAWVDPFELGLARVLDGVETLVESRQAAR